MSNASKKLGKARAGLILDQPFFGSLALRLNLVEAPVRETPGKKKKRRTASTNGKAIKYNPEWIESLSLDETKGVICHEIMHCANQHHTRRGDRKSRKWKLACDYAINPLIEECGLTLPVGILSDPQFYNMSAEDIYTKLPESEDEDDDDDDDPGGCGDVDDAPGKDGKQASAGDKLQTAQEWKIAVAQAATQAKAMDEMPDALERLVDEILEPELNWREILRRFVDTSARNDYQWFPPNRRHIHNGLILPSLRSQELKNVTMAMDTSGSITNDDLKAFEAEVRAIIQDYRANTKVIYCDDEVRRVEEFDADTPVELHPRGGGGTRFSPVFGLIEESREYPACLVYQTDGYCNDFPKEEPSYPVLWILSKRNDSFCPPFGTVIHL